jgi:hypothetical protein
MHAVYVIIYPYLPAFTTAIAFQFLNNDAMTMSRENRSQKDGLLQNRKKELDDST